MNKRLYAVFFDLDGVLVDACDWHYDALNLALKQVAGFSISRQEHLKKFNGLPTKTKLNMLLEEKRISNDHINNIKHYKQKFTIDLIEKNLNTDLKKVELIRYLCQNSIVTGCVTNCITETAKLMLRRIGVFQYLDHFYSNEMVLNPKPHAEGYVTAMVAARSMPAETLIVEDSPKGILSAKSTGANVWVVKDATEVRLTNFKSTINELGFTWPK